MESQQTRLIEALRRLHRHVKQPIDEEDMQEILQTARACGFDFDFEGVQDIQYNYSESNALRAEDDIPEPFGDRATNGFNDNNVTIGRYRNSVVDRVTGHECLGKRKRAESGQLLNTTITPGNDVAIVENVGNSLPNTNGGSELEHESSTSPLKRQKPAAATETVDDYWKFDSYFDQATTPDITSKMPTMPGAVVSNPMFDANPQDVSNFLQQPSEMPVWSWKDVPQPLTTTDDDPSFELNGTTNTYPVGEPSEASSTFEAPHDWGSTMWWDPALLFDTRLDNSDLGGDGLPTQPLDLSHDVNEGSFFVEAPEE